MGLDCVEGSCTCSLILGYKEADGLCNEKSFTTHLVLVYSAVELLTVVVLAMFTFKILFYRKRRQPNFSCRYFRSPLPSTYRGNIKSALLWAFINQLVLSLIVSSHLVAAIGLDPHLMLFGTAGTALIALLYVSCGLACYNLGAAWIEVSLRIPNCSLAKLKLWWRIMKHSGQVVILLPSCFFLLRGDFCVNQQTHQVGSSMPLIVIPMLTMVLGVVTILAGKNMVQNVMNPAVSERGRNEVHRVIGAAHRVKLSIILFLFGFMGTCVSTAAGWSALWWWEFQLFSMAVFMMWYAAIISYADRRAELPLFLRVMGGQSTLLEHQHSLTGRLAMNE
ncbi:unnamed protein product [Heterosigma akashiwo]